MKFDFQSFDFKISFTNILSLTILLFFLTLIQSLNAQSVEYYAGDKRTGVDLMWFKYFKDSKNENTPLLFFSRNRASVDYKNSPTAFGSTNAISYNFKNGVGIVSVASFLNNGFTPKAGIQYYKQKGDFMFFGWAVADIKKDTNIDVFGLFRFTPKLNEKWRLFSQLELFPIYNPSSEFWNITQRLRIGPKFDRFTFGVMADFNQSGITNFNTTENMGGFLRYDF
jgi:hypothetical protein